MGLIGMTHTFLYAKFILIPAFMTFAHTWALHYVSTYDWVRTSWRRKLIRTIIGVIICVGYFVGRYYYRLRIETPVFIITNQFIFISFTPFLIFGLLPIFFKWIGLVKRENSLRDLPSGGTFNSVLAGRVSVQ
jgi:hypothetical protein